MRSVLNTSKGGRLIGYARNVSMFVESNLKKDKFYSYKPNIEGAVQTKRKDIVYNQIHHNMTSSNVLNLGIETHGGDVCMHKTYKNGLLSALGGVLSPEEFFHVNGRHVPSNLNVMAPDINKPVTSIVEVATVGFVSSQFPQTKIVQSSQLINKNSPFNFSNQARPDCKLEVLLNNGKIFTCWVDSKTVNYNVMIKKLANLSYYKSGDKLECNFYFVGGFRRTHLFSFKETNGIVRLMHDKCTDLINTNDPEASLFVSQNLPFITKFSSTGLLSDLQKSQICPFIFGQDQFGSWFSSLSKFP